MAWFGITECSKPLATIGATAALQGEREREKSIKEVYLIYYFEMSPNDRGLQFYAFFRHIISQTMFKLNL